MVAAVIQDGELQWRAVMASDNDVRSVSKADFEYSYRTFHCILYSPLFFCSSPSLALGSSIHSCTHLVTHAGCSSFQSASRNDRMVSRWTNNGVCAALRRVNRFKLASKKGQGGFHSYHQKGLRSGKHQAPVGIWSAMHDPLLVPFGAPRLCSWTLAAQGGARKGSILQYL